MSFSDLGLLPELLRAVADKGYDSPTPIQAQAIPAVLAGRDVLAGAQTGTGKTAGFVLPILQRLMSVKLKHPATGFLKAVQRKYIGGRQTTCKRNDFWLLGDL